MTHGGALLAAHDASFAYPCGDRHIGPFDLAIQSGSLTLVRGPSGCGKSTLVRLLCGIIPHLYEGDLRGGVRLTGLPIVDMPLWRVTSRVGAVFQNPELQFLGSTVGEEIDFALSRTEWSREQRSERRRELMERFQLGAWEERDPRRLSGGEQQRVIIAAASSRRPEVVLLDEPMSMLDREAAAAVVEQVDSLREEGTAAVVFEHRRTAFAARADVSEVTLGTTATLIEPPPIRPREGVLEVGLRGVAVERDGRLILRDVDLNLRGGSALAIHGANGSGKTTLLRVLCGLQDYRGRMSPCIDGRAVPGTTMGLCFQNPDHQIFNATVRAELRYGRAAIDEDFYRSIVVLLGLSELEERPPLLLSEGEKKRLALGLLLLRPGLYGLCLDEPTLGQDDSYRERLGQVVRRLVEAGYLCVVATHDAPWAQRWCDSVLRIEDGHVRVG